MRMMDYFVGKNAAVLIIWMVVDTDFPCCDEDCVPLLILPIKGERKEDHFTHSWICLVA